MPPAAFAGSYQFTQAGGVISLGQGKGAQVTPRGDSELWSTGPVATQVTNGWLSLLVSSGLESLEVGGKADWDVL